VNVIVESNFVLELAFRHSEADSARQILELAEAKQIQLAIPAYALVEPLHKLHRIRATRRDFSQKLDQELAQMERSADFSDVRSKSTDMLIALAKKSDVDDSEYWAILKRIAKCATVIELTGDVVVSASARKLYDLGAQDSLIFCSVEAFLNRNQGTKSLFANKNSKDFLVQTVSDDLSRLGCEVVVTFGAALGRINSDLAKGAGKNS